jgi:hypothetical protein
MFYSIGASPKLCISGKPISTALHDEFRRMNEFMKLLLQCQLMHVSRVNISIHWIWLVCGSENYHIAAVAQNGYILGTKK